MVDGAGGDSREGRSQGSSATPREGAAPRDDRVRRRRSRRRAVLLWAVGLLYIASVPWYRASDAPLRIVFGLPDWVAVALGCYVAVAVLNAWAWLSTDIDDSGSSSRPPARRHPQRNSGPRA